MLAVQRTHRLRDDRDWLPAGVRRAGWLVSGAVWGGAGVAIAGAVAVAPAVLVLWKGLLLGGVGAALAGERAGHLAFRRRLTKLTRGEVELADVGRREEGELVVVRGTIAPARETIGEPVTLTGVVRDRPGVYRRLIFEPGRAWVHEAAVDFALVDERGHRVLVQAGGARWLVPTPELVTYPAWRFDHDLVPARVRELVRASGRPAIEAVERILPVGARVQVVGYKTQSADVSGDVMGYREAPQRATLRSGPTLPLVITTLDDLA